MPPKKHPAGRHGPKDAINFVNARPSSESEKLDIKRAVRAHVGKWISTQTSKDRIGVAADADADAGVGAGPAVVVHPAPLVDISGNTEQGALAFELDSDEAFPPASASASASSASASALSPGSSLSSRGSPDSSISSSSHNSASVPVSNAAQSQRELAGALVPAQNYVHSAVPEASHRCHGQEDCRCGSSDPDASAHPEERIEEIGAGCLDPFRAYAGQFEPELVRTSEEYCTSVPVFELY